MKKNRILDILAYIYIDNNKEFFDEVYFTEKNVLMYFSSETQKTMKVSKYDKNEILKTIRKYKLIDDFDVLSYDFMFSKNELEQVLELGK